MSLKNEAPKINELPTSYADRLALIYSLKVSFEHKKEFGQFFTPLKVADFMADFCTITKNKIKILDPGCGVGILSCSIIERLVKENKNLTEIDLVAFETDSQLLTYTDACFEYLSKWLRTKEVKFSYFLCKNDFILHNSNVLIENSRMDESYDIIVANPPYFKINKMDPRAIAAKSVIYGQTNIYSIFLLIAAKLLINGGQLIFITPRSFSSGSYFRVFREKFFAMVNITNVHLFSSRKEAFERDKILQENIIVVAKKKIQIAKNQIRFPFKSNDLEYLKISTSQGISDVNQSVTKNYFFNDLVNLDSEQKILHIPATENDESAIKLFKSWNSNLKTFKMEISTGPVVDFRSSEFIQTNFKKNCVPLIYLHNIDKMKFSWPAPHLRKGKVKGEYIIESEKSESRLVANKDYVFLRRFSSKDDKSRLIASPYFSKWLSEYNMLGIENHLNYIYRPLGAMLETEAYGLAAILNSKLFDVYFRTFNGNINVSATELREMPLPKLKIIQNIGRRIINSKKNDQKIIDSIVQEELQIELN